MTTSAPTLPALDRPDRAIETPDQRRARKARRRAKPDSFWRACRFLAPYRAMVAASIACAFASNAFFVGGLGVLLPILQILIDGQTVPGWVAGRIASEHPDGGVPFYLRWAESAAALLPENPVATIAVLFGLITLLALVGNAIKFFQEYLSDKAAVSAVNDARRRLYDRVLHLPLGYFGTRGTSDLTSRLVGDAAQLQEGFKTVLGRGVQEPVSAGFALGLALLIDWRLTGFIVVFAPLMFVALKKFGKKMRRASRAAMQSNAAMLGQLEASLAGVRVVKAAGAERHERRKYGRVMSGLLDEQLRMARYEAFSGPVLETLGMLAAGSVLIVASYLVLIQRSLDAPSFLLVVGCLVAIGESMRRLSKINNVLQRGNAAAARIFEALDLEPEGRARKSEVGSRKGGSADPVPTSDFPLPTSRRLPPLAREIRFENVTFAYPEAPAPAVAGVSLVVPRGRSVAVVGRNGSGKTTLLALLPRFYDPQSGRIRIDGVDVRAASLRSLRRQIAVVTQEAVVFPGTIAENIAYARPLATREEVIDAAKQAHAHEFIVAKPGGYDARVDGLGGGMSGGQKQRLNIARAVLRDAPILILDEATSQVDAESEHLIQQAIAGLMKGRTTFVIAHRFSTILGADQIVVMDAGRVVGAGTHDELMGSCETYRQLYERQLFAA